MNQFFVERRYVANHRTYRWCIIRAGEIQCHRDLKRDADEMAGQLNALYPEPELPAMLTQKQIDEREGEPQGPFRKLIWRAAKR